HALPLLVPAEAGKRVSVETSGNVAFRLLAGKRPS
ncbi:hypothetical protein HKBW3S42_00558, partial [Candidatus Hakubella thermalkaliphila]